ncbi:glyoxal reductase isoform X2 [Acipenser oxyrinchus oxyrinchus]|uniref:Glyoxal reductase isoform X2 n=1 Tax=Acipenser oxyrinchus oxyrinchus TaxID=40147 RepID=A0AAD8CT24_ACIOX|nr:glyoxal reductase isoform X2 [Acipenser oxyrinchus oxyrinchus]
MAETVELNNGVRMPVLGLGTFKLRGYEAVYRALDAALAEGYRSFDTAAVYRNEGDIGRALKELLPRHGLTRPDVFITSKLGPKDHGSEARAACEVSLEQLGWGYLDLYLIHWPGKQGWQSEDLRNREVRRESWEALEEMYKSGRFRAIGVSNYTLTHLQELLGSCKVSPAVLQVEYHPRLVQNGLLSFCRETGIHLQAYSSLGTGSLVKEPKVRDVVERYGKTPAQVLLAWALRQGVGVIPKSGDPQRIAENARALDLAMKPEDVLELSSLDSGTRYCWDPQGVV